MHKFANNFSPKHLVITPDQKDNHDLKNNFVRIKVEDIGATDLVSMRKELLESGSLGSLEIKQIKKKIEEHVIKDAKAILYKGDEMLEKYLDEVGTSDLDRSILLKIGKKICAKAEQS